MESDALIVAKWCWPEHDWSVMGVSPVGCKRGTDTTMAYFEPKRWTTDADLREFGVIDAERVVIERGLAEAYGKELAYLAPGATETPSSRPYLTIFYSDVAAFATATQEARVRALAAVIRNLTL